jgi:hypothetical protein
MQKKEPIKQFKPGVYKHFKGQKYLALFTSKHSETLEDYVVYISLYNNKKSQLWIRPLKDFNGYKKMEDGTRVKRFKFIKDR